MIGTNVSLQVILHQLVRNLPERLLGELFGVAGKPSEGNKLDNVSRSRNSSGILSSSIPVQQLHGPEVGLTNTKKHNQ
jgi:hypothetical protein